MFAQKSGKKMLL